MVGYRFKPGPALRAAGVRCCVLRMGLEEAKAFRDAAIAGQAPAPGPKPAAAPRTLHALWAAFEAHAAQAIARNAALPADRRDDDAIAPDTLRFYRSMIKPWLACAGEEPAAALDAEIIESLYKTQKAARGHSTAHAAYRALLAVLAFGVRIKWLPANEAKGLKLSRPRGRLRLGAPEEIKALVDAADAIPALETLGGAEGRLIGDAIVAALWTGQRQQDLLACDLGHQLRDGFLIFARTHEADFSQQKVRGRVDEGGQAHVKVLPPLAMRLRGRSSGLLLPAPGGVRWNAHTFRHAFAEVRARAAQACPSAASLQFRDLRDTAVTRLALAGVTIADIALWTGHSLKTIEAILKEHYLVSTRASADQVGERIEAWRKRTGVMW